VNVLFDNCLPPVYAATLDGFISFLSHRSFHIKDVAGLPKGRHSTDLEWIGYLQRHPETWIFVTGDGRLLKNRAERAALPVGEPARLCAGARASESASASSRRASRVEVAGDRGREVSDPIHA
jgi:hypothetical protein